MTVLGRQRYLQAFSLLIMPSARALSSSTVATSAVTNKLQDPTLLDWKSSASAATTKTFDVTNPANPTDILGTIASVSSSRAPAEIIQASHTALQSWRDGTTAAHRGSLLTSWSHHIKSNVEDLATIMTLESGKPMTESRGEVNYAASFLDYYAAEAIRPTGAGGGFLTPSPYAHPGGGSRGHIIAMQQAVGLVGLITPWNFPMAMITRKVGPALAAGCTTVLKPSELTPLSAIALYNLAARAGIPENVFQLV